MPRRPPAGGKARPKHLSLDLKVHIRAKVQFNPIGCLRFRAEFGIITDAVIPRGIGFDKNKNALLGLVTLKG